MDDYLLFCFLMFIKFWLKYWNYFILTKSSELLHLLDFQKEKIVLILMCYVCFIEYITTFTFLSITMAISLTMAISMAMAINGVPTILISLFYLPLISSNFFYLTFSVRQWVRLKHQHKVRSRYLVLHSLIIWYHPLCWLCQQFICGCSFFIFCNLHL